MIDKVQLTPVQRAAAVDRTGENIALLSGAGCGKTFVLARRFTELLMANRGRQDPLSRFVALTFTDKAALEMSRRVRDMLAALASTSKGADRRRLLDWLMEIPEARISTIHAFCASVLRTHAIEAGVDPNFAVCPDELAVEQMIEESAEQAILEALEAQSPDLAGALTMVSYEQLARQIHLLVDGRTAWDAATYADPDATLHRWKEKQSTDEKAAWDELTRDQALPRELDSLAAADCDDSDDRLARWRDERVADVRRLLDEPPSRTAETLGELKTGPGNIGSPKAWGGKERLKEIRDRLKSVAEAVGGMSIYHQQQGPIDRQAAELLATITALAGRAEQLYAARKRRRGLLDFTDLLTTTHSLLSGNSSVRKSLSRQIDQLLVDEAQDTSALQIALLELLTFGQAGSDTLPDGRLFLVGDGKQSIYRFRGAQVEVFDDLCRRLGPGHQENLDRSFRTHDSGVAFINHLFGPLMGAGYAPIHAHRRITPTGPTVEILLAEGTNRRSIVNSQSASDAQAAVVAQRIGEMVANAERLVWDQAAGDWRPVNYRDVAILFAKMTNSLTYERLLALRGVPYYVVGGTGFFRQQEVFDILNALRVIDNPFDDVAFFGLLRSSMIGLDDNALVHVASALDPPYLPKLAGMTAPGRQENSPGIAVGGISRQDGLALGFAVDLICRLRRVKNAIGIDETIERLLTQTGYEATLLSQFQGRRMLGNVRLLADQARSAAAEGMALADFIVRANEQVLSQSRYEQAAAAGQDQNVVSLMTIHKAKGLEFPVVVIPDLNSPGRGLTGMLLNRSDWGLTCKLKEDAQGQDADGAELPVSFCLAKRREEQDQSAEDIRRLYVAATRHRDHLIFAGADWRTADGEFREAKSYLRKMDEILGICQALDAGASTIPYGDGRYAAALRKVPPTFPTGRRRASAGESMLAQANSGPGLAGKIMKSRPPSGELPLVGPLPTRACRAELAVTALVDFEHCPMLYRWRHEQRVPSAESARQQSAGVAAPGLDPLATGIFYHRCLELLDFARPQSAAALSGQVLAEMGLEESPGADAMAGDLAQMLLDFRAQPLFGAIAAARQAFSELDFAMLSGPATIRGQIDLLYQDDSGGWHIVDYKSDHVAPVGSPSRTRRYELQMLIYAAAAARHLQAIPADATLYFLRAHEAHPLKIDEAMLASAQARAEGLAERLIAASRAGSFKRRSSATCRWCPYRELCDNSSVEEL